MSMTQTRLRRAATGLALVSAMAIPVAAEAGTATKPTVSNFKVTPRVVKEGNRIDVRFKTRSGGAYTIYYATRGEGGPFDNGTGKAKAGAKVNKKVKVDVSPIKKLTVGVIVTIGTHQARKTTTIKVVKK